MKRNFKSNPKIFYKFVNLKVRVRQFPGSIKLGNKEGSTSVEIADMFTEFFQKLTLLILFILIILIALKK